MKINTLLVSVLVVCLSMTTHTSFSSKGTYNQARARDLYASGAAMYFSGDFHNAAIVLDSAVQMDSTFANAYNILGLSYLKLHQWQNAERAVRRAIELDSNYAFAYYNLGEVIYSSPLSDEKQEVAAIQYWRKAIELDTSQTQIVKMRVEIGNALKMHADIHGAITEYQEALRLDPTCLPALIELAMAYRDLGDIAGSDLLLKRVIELDSNFVPALNVSGDILLVDNQLLGALRMYFRAVEFDSTCCRSYVILIRTLNVFIEYVTYYRDHAFSEAKIREWRKDGQFRPWPGLFWSKAKLDSIIDTDIDRHSKQYELNYRACNDSLFIAGFLRSKFHQLRLAILMQEDNSRPLYRCAEFYDVLQLVLSKRRSEVVAQGKRVIPNCQLPGCTVSY